MLPRVSQLPQLDEYRFRVRLFGQIGKFLAQPGDDAGAAEAKEGVEIQQENQTLASITYQNYFRLYPKLAGMTGTAMTEAAEFSDIYKLEVVEVIVAVLIVLCKHTVVEQF